MSKQEQMQMQLLLKNDVINGFSYSFTKYLLNKLEKLSEEDRIFEDSKDEIERAKHNSVSRLTLIAESVATCLSRQLKLSEDTYYGYSQSKKITELINTAEEFLTIFEKKE